MHVNYAQLPSEVTESLAGMGESLRREYPDVHVVPSLCNPSITPSFIIIFYVRGQPGIDRRIGCADGVRASPA